MKLYVYAPKRKEGLDKLVEALKATRLVQFDGIDFWAKGQRLVLENGSVVVCWGGVAAGVPGVKFVNGTMNLRRSDQLMKLGDGGIATPQLLYPDNNYTVESFVQAGYIPRVNGRSMLSVYQDVPTSVDYFTMKVISVKETRTHLMDGTIFAHGEQAVRKGFKVAKKWLPNADLAHPFVKTWETGWQTNYIAAPAKFAGGLIMEAARARLGAVSVLWAQENRSYILKVDTAPPLDDTIFHHYVSGLKKMIAEV